MPPRVTPNDGQYKVKILNSGTSVVNLLGTAHCTWPAGFKSHIDHWRRVTGQPAPPCCIQGCPKSGSTGSHVKIAGSVPTAALKRTWYIVPSCNEHNKKLSCACHAVKVGTLAVETPVGLGDRLKSWSGDLEKLALAVQGKKR